MYDKILSDNYIYIVILLLEIKLSKEFRKTKSIPAVFALRDFPKLVF